MCTVFVFDIHALQVPDTDDDVDVNDIRDDELINMNVKTFITPTIEEEKDMGKEHCAPLYTFEGILLYRRIPLEFLHTVIEHNKEHRKNPTLNKETVLDYNTNIVMPHRDNVKAVKFALKLRRICGKEVSSILKAFRRYGPSYFSFFLLKR